jgi:predicted membrane protein
MTDSESWREQRRRHREERIKMIRERWGNRGFYAMHAKGSIWTGLFILLVGVAALLKASLTGLPDWVFSWQTFLIAYGLFIGLKHGFKGASWFMLILIGGAFLLPEIYPDLTIRRYIWPMALIVLGIFFILRPRRRWHAEYWEKKSGVSSGPGPDPLVNPDPAYSKDDFVDSTSIFGGANKIILSKDFKGGDITNIFGGTELNLIQADINGTAILEMTTIFGGTKLIIPSNWTIKSEATIIFGSIEDKRSMPTTSSSPEKVLLLKGTVIFGGIEIKSF